MWPRSKSIIDASLCVKSTSCREDGGWTTSAYNFRPLPVGMAIDREEKAFSLELNWLQNCLFASFVISELNLGIRTIINALWIWIYRRNRIELVATVCSALEYVYHSRVSKLCI